MRLKFDDHELLVIEELACDAKEVVNELSRTLEVITGQIRLLLSVLEQLDQKEVTADEAIMLIKNILMMYEAGTSNENEMLFV